MRMVKLRDGDGVFKIFSNCSSGKKDHNSITPCRNLFIVRIGSSWCTNVQKFVSEISVWSWE